MTIQGKRSTALKREDDRVEREQWAWKARWATILPVLCGDGHELFNPESDALIDAWCQVLAERELRERILYEIFKEPITNLTTKPHQTKGRSDESVKFTEYEWMLIGGFSFRF